MSFARTFPYRIYLLSCCLIFLNLSLGSPLVFHSHPRLGAISAGVRAKIGQNASLQPMATTPGTQSDTAKSIQADPMTASTSLTGTFQHSAGGDEAGNGINSSKRLQPTTTATETTADSTDANTTPPRQDTDDNGSGHAQETPQDTKSLSRSDAAEAAAAAARVLVLNPEGQDWEERAAAPSPKPVEQPDWSATKNPTGLLYYRASKKLSDKIPSPRSRRRSRHAPASSGRHVGDEEGEDEQHVEPPSDDVVHKESAVAELLASGLAARYELALLVCVRKAEPSLFVIGKICANL